ncbi:extracellular solute-binding protein [Lachnospiraceae bacterium ASD3451]|uniref:ABC transporter substrate-binding protein n=1 Tax=Diplocloster agilis TaxID=2850323 RepID=UPI001D20C61D|nr:extracellular solute-binding protein [Diplocloster agilis]MBU9742622.1 extracellular solute-binding protein [Diplocloster agilis]
MKKKFTAFLSILLVMGCLAGCGNAQSTEDTSQAKPNEQDASTPEPAAKEDADAQASKEPVTIHLFHQKQEAQETFAQIIEAFQKEYPYITVEQEIVTNDPASILRARVATDETPDIFQGALDTMDIASGGYIMDLAGEPFLNNINEEVLSDSSFTDGDGHVWALPIDGSCEGIFYNKEIFQKLDLTPPTTLSELDHVIEVLEKNKITPFALGFKDSWTIKPITLVVVSPAIYAKQDDWNELKTSGQSSFADTPEWKTTFDILKKVYDHGNTKTAFDTDYNGACNMIAQGEAAMMVQGLWALEPIKSINSDINLGMMAMPVSENPEDTKLFQFPDFGLSISANTKNPEECKLFLEYLTRQDTASLWCSSSMLFSAIKNVSVDFDPLAADVNAYIDSGMICTQADRGWPTAFQTEYEASLSEYILGHDSLENILARLDTAWDTAVKAAQ